MPRNLLTMFAAALTLAACSGDDKPAADPALSQDLALASQVQPATQPTLQDTPLPAAPAPEPRAPQRLPQTPTVRPAPQQVQPVQRPAPATPPPAPVTQAAPDPVRPDPIVTATPVASGASGGSGAREIGGGATLNVSSTARVCTAVSRPGDKVVARLDAPVTGSNGAVIPAGSSIVLEVASVTPGESDDSGNISFRLRSVVVGAVSYPATGDVTTLGSYERTRIASESGSDAKKVVGGAVIGAIAGRVIGGSTKGAVVGAAAGAATGAVVAKAGQKYDACLGEGTPMRVVLHNGIVIG
jgi:hypothetical protein